MEFITVSGIPFDWSKFPPCLPSVRLDAFHETLSEPKRFTYRQMRDVPHVTALPNIEEDTEARGSVLEAWLACRSPVISTPYYRETLWVAMAPFVKRISYGEDSFQKGMTAIWQHLPTWVENYPVNHDESTYDDGRLDSVLYDVVRYLVGGVALNAMRGRQRKPTIFDDRLVVNAKDTKHALNPFTYIDELPFSDQHKEILYLKSEGLSEFEIGKVVGLSRDQVKRRIKELYNHCCDDMGLRPTPMGRAKRKNLQQPPQAIDEELFVSG
jgi:hypothetical protein